MTSEAERSWCAPVGQRSALSIVLLGGLASFSAYFSMYAFRKPFTAATFDHVSNWPFALDYKTALIIAQLVGYAMAKIIGVKIIAELGQARRALAIVALIGVSWLALVLFAIVPVPWNVVALFLNGLPLGLIWGLVFSYVEGRRTSEPLGAILCASFILSSGVVKSVGRWLLDGEGVSAFWMPAATGALFFPLLLLAVVGLARLPPPDASDHAERVERTPMKSAQRAAFFRRHRSALVPLLVAYVLLTTFRDVRDNFAAEIWRALGFENVAALFTASEVPVAIVTLATLGALMLVRDNRRALLLIHAAVLGGALLIASATLAFQMGVLGPIAWMMLAGAGLYIAYTPFNAMLFDRMIAATGEVGTAGFLIYLADSCGYLGSVTLLLLRTLASIRLDWLRFFEMLAYGTAALTIVGVVVSARHFQPRTPGEARPRWRMDVQPG